MESDCLQRADAAVQKGSISISNRDFTNHIADMTLFFLDSHTSDTNRSPQTLAQKELGLSTQYN
jgi:hypothetical protein